MLTIPSGSIIIVPDVAFVIRDFVTFSGSPLYAETLSFLKETGAKTRSMARFGVPYTYKGHPLPAFEFGPVLLSLKQLIEDALGTSFNAAVVNRYADESKGVAPHSDTQAIPQLGKQPIIAGLSFGATRDFVIQGRKKIDQPIVTQVNHGDLLVMHGTSQSHYKHSVPTDLTRVILPRWSVTFRQHIIVNTSKEEDKINS